MNFHEMTSAELREFARRMTKAPTPDDPMSRRIAEIVKMGRGGVFREEDALLNPETSNLEWRKLFAQTVGEK